MAYIPGTRLDITGASGSQGLLTPKSGWFAYVLPRGAFAAQDSTGTVITFDSADISARFAVDDWVQVGLSTDNLRKVNGVGGGSISVAGSNVTVTENDRVLLIGSTQPSVTGGSATYIIPKSFVYYRDDDGSDRYTNSMVTSDTNGGVKFYAPHGLYDVLIQDGNQANQGYLADLPLGAAEGVSTTLWAIFGATVTINAALGVTGTLTANTLTVHRALGVTGWATFGSTVTMNAALGVTGAATLSGPVVAGTTLTVNGQFGVTGYALFGATATVNGALGVTGQATFGTTVTVSDNDVLVSSGDVRARRYTAHYGTMLVAGDFSLNGEWGSTASVSVGNSSYDTHGFATVSAYGATFGTNPQVTLTFKDGAWPTPPYTVVCRADTTLPHSGFWHIASRSTTSVTFGFTGGDLVNNKDYSFIWITVG